MSNMKRNIELLPVGTPAKFSGTDRVGTIAGYATAAHVTSADAAPSLLYVLDLGMDHGFYAPSQDTFVSLLLVSANNIEVLS